MRAYVPVLGLLLLGAVPVLAQEAPAKGDKPPGRPRVTKRARAVLDKVKDLAVSPLGADAKSLTASVEMAMILDKDDPDGYRQVRHYSITWGRKDGWSVEEGEGESRTSAGTSAMKSQVLDAFRYSMGDFIERDGTKLGAWVDANGHLQTRFHRRSESGPRVDWRLESRGLPVLGRVWVTDGASESQRSAIRVGWEPAGKRYRVAEFQMGSPSGPAGLGMMYDWGDDPDRAVPVGWKTELMITFEARVTAVEVDGKDLLAKDEPESSTDADEAGD